LQALFGMKPENQPTFLSIQQAQNPDANKTLSEQLFKLLKGQIDPAFAYTLSQTDYVPK
jgi:hypothetical protein